MSQNVIWFLFPAPIKKWQIVKYAYSLLLACLLLVSSLPEGQGLSQPHTMDAWHCGYNYEIISAVLVERKKGRPVRPPYLESGLLKLSR